QAVATEVVREGNTLFAHSGQFGLALGDQLVLFLVLGLQVLRLVGHVGESRKNTVRLWARSARAMTNYRAAAGLQAHFQAGLNELIKVTVEYRVAVAVLDTGAQVLDTRLIQHVG